MKSKTLWLVGAATVWCLTVTAAIADAKTGDDRAAACARDAKGLKGDERQDSIAKCMKEATGGGHSQQNKMKTCNVEAGNKGLRGDERRAFMSSCLRG